MFICTKQVQNISCQISFSILDILEMIEEPSKESAEDQTSEDAEDNGRTIDTEDNGRTMVGQQTQKTMVEQ